MSIITKALIGEEDIQKYDGTNTSFTRTTSTGGTNTLTPVGAGISGLKFASVFLKNMNNVLFADQFPGADIGAKINAAYAALPASGGTIWVVPNPTGTPYNFSTPIVFATSGKFVTLRGMGTVGGGGSSAWAGTVLNYTPTTATAAITLDYVPSAGIGNAPVNHGLRDIALINNQIIATGGGGSSAVGIQIGNTNAGAYDASMENVSIGGFGTGYVNTNNLSVNTSWLNPFFQANTLAWQGSSVVEKFLNGVFAGNGQIVQSTTNQTPELYFTNTNTFGNNSNGAAFDFTRSSTSPGNLHLVNCHLENTNATNAHYIQGNVNVYMVSGVIEDDNSTGTGDWMVSLTGACLIRVIGTSILSSRAYTNIFLMNANSRGVIQAANGSPSMLTSGMFVGGANAAFVTQMISPVGSSISPYQWFFESPLGLAGKITTYNGIATVSNGMPSELATVDLTAQVAAVSATTLYTPVTTGMFRVSAYLKITTTGTSPVIGPVTITYTDGTDSVAQSIVMSQQLQTGVMSNIGNNGNTTVSVLTGSLYIFAKAGVAIQYAIALTGTVGAAQYEAHLKCEAL